MAFCGACCIDSPNSFATDQICGNFFFPCGTEQLSVWDSKEVIPVGTVSIYYARGCTKTVFVEVTNSFGTVDTFEVPARNTCSRTYANLVSVKITSLNGEGLQDCEGKYCLNLHYSP